MSFVADEREVLDKISFMSRCYWTTQLDSRVLYRPDGPPTHSLLSFDVSANRFVDGLNLTADGPIAVWEFERPDRHMLRTPDDRLVMYVTVGDGPTEATFHEVDVAADGTISVTPLVTLATDDPAALARTLGVVAAFVPDVTNADGSCDLFLGVPWRYPGSDARVIRDFIPPRRQPVPSPFPVPRSPVAGCRLPVAS